MMHRTAFHGVVPAKAGPMRLVPSFGHRADAICNNQRQGLWVPAGRLRNIHSAAFCGCAAGPT